MSKTHYRPNEHHQRYDRLYNKRSYQAITVALDVAEAATVDPVATREWYGLPSWERELLDTGEAEAVLPWRDAAALAEEVEAERWAAASGLDFDRVDLGLVECESGEVYGSDLDHDEYLLACAEQDYERWLDSVDRAHEAEADLYALMAAPRSEPLGDRGGPLVSRGEFAALVEEGFTYKVVVTRKVPGVDVRTPGMRVKHLAERLGVDDARCIALLAEVGEHAPHEQYRVATPVVREVVARAEAKRRASRRTSAAMAGVFSRRMRRSGF